MNIGCDLDGTLAKYDHWKGINHIGEPVPLVVEAVKEALRRGHHVWIFTARANADNPDREIAIEYISAWCLRHIGQVLPVTANKGYNFDEFWDDRAVSITRNMGMAREDAAEEIRPPTVWDELKLAAWENAGAVVGTNRNTTTNPVEMDAAGAMCC